MLDPTPGMRVVIRYRDGDGAADALGEVETASEASIRVRTKRGPIDVDRADVLLMHEVPPAPVRAAPPHAALSAPDLRRIGAAGWLPQDSVWLHASTLRTELSGDAADADAPTLERGWLLRASQSGSKRSSSVLPLDDPEIPAEEALTAAESFYERRGLAPIVQLYSDMDSSELAAPCRAVAGLLRGRGYEPTESTLLLTGSTAEAAQGMTRAAEAALPGLRLEVSDAPTEQHFAAWGRPDAESRSDFAQLIACSRPQFVTAYAQHPDGTESMVASCRMAESKKWAIITNLVTDPALRRRGAGRAVVRAALATASGRGIRSYLADVVDDNEPSLGLFRSIGAVPRQRSWHARRA